MKKFHIVFKVKEEDFYSRGMFIEANTSVEALERFNSLDVANLGDCNATKGIDTIFLAMYVVKS